MSERLGECKTPEELITFYKRNLAVSDLRQSKKRQNLLLKNSIIERVESILLKGEEIEFIDIKKREGIEKPITYMPSLEYSGEIALINGVYIAGRFRYEKDDNRFSGGVNRYVLRGQIGTLPLSHVKLILIEIAASNENIDLFEFRAGKNYRSTSLGRPFFSGDYQIEAVRRMGVKI